jgi:hypothetical protein
MMVIKPYQKSMREVVAIVNRWLGPGVKIMPIVRHTIAGAATRP